MDILDLLQVGDPWHGYCKPMGGAMAVFPDGSRHGKILESRIWSMVLRHLPPGGSRHKPIRAASAAFRETIQTEVFTDDVIPSDWFGRLGRVHFCRASATVRRA
jgi:hypothetical protein